MKRNFKKLVPAKKTADTEFSDDNNLNIDNKNYISKNVEKNKAFMQLEFSN